MGETRERRRPLTVRRSAIQKPGPACLLLAVCVWAPLGAQGQALQPEEPPNALEGPGPSAGVEPAGVQQERVHWESIWESIKAGEVEVCGSRPLTSAEARLAEARLQQYREEKLWKSALARNTLDAFLSYLRDYPKGRFAETARRHVQELADANADDDLGDTGLHWAVKENAVEVARVLLDAGADVSVESGYDGGPQSVDRDTPLHFAVMKGNADMVRMLLDYGADASAADEDGFTPLHFVDKADIARMLLDAGAEVLSTAKASYTALFMAVYENEADIVRMLIDAGADVRHRVDFDRSALHVAVARGVAADIVRMLLEAGAAVDARDNDGRTPLHVAAHANTEELARVLLEAGAAVDAKDDEGWTPLIVAAENDAADTVRMLLEAGASRSEVPKRPRPSR